MCDLLTGPPMSLARIFFEHLPDELRSSGQLDAGRLEQLLASAIDAGQRAWPQLAVPPDAFVRHVAQRIPAGSTCETALDSLHAGELYLAFACHLGDPRAIATLEHAYKSHLDAVIAGLNREGLTAEDFRQIVRRRLFVRETGQDAKISAYAGQGSLAAWLRVTARRVGLNAVRGKRVDAQSTDHQDLFDLPQSLGDPELDYLKDTYREEFRSAFLSAVEGLDARDRTLLRQTIVHRLTVRQIARMYQVHHATVARWISQARERLVEGTRAHLQARLEISQRELDSIMGLIASRLDVSVVRVLGREDD